MREGKREKETDPVRLSHFSSLAAAISTAPLVFPITAYRDAILLTSLTRNATPAGSLGLACARALLHILALSQREAQHSSTLTTSTEVKSVIECS
jgi:hypothetical protein